MMILATTRRARVQRETHDDLEQFVAQKRALESIESLNTKADRRNKQYQPGQS